MITECELFWRAQYCKLHRVKDDNRTQSFKDATIAALRFERCVYMGAGSSLKVLPEIILKVPIGTSKRWFYAHTDGNSNLVHHLHSLTSSTLTEYFIIEDAGELEEGRSVLWSWSTNEGALFYTHNGCWLFVHYPDSPPSDRSQSSPCDRPLPVRVWQDDIHSLAHVVFGGCPDCRLVVQVNKQIKDGGVWSLDVVELPDRSPEVVQTETLSFHFLPDPQLQSSCLFTILSVQLHPSNDSEKSSVNSRPFCHNHLVFFQIGTAITVNQLCLEEGRGFKLTGPLRYSWTDSNHINPSKFVLNEDCSMAVFMPNPTTLCAWDPKEDITYTHSLSPYTQSARPVVISAGRLYSLVGLVSPVWFEVHIVSTTTGRTVFKAQSMNRDTNVTDVSMTLSNVGLDELSSATSCSSRCWHRLSCEFLGLSSRSQSVCLFVSIT